MPGWQVRASARLPARAHQEQPDSARRAPFLKFIRNASCCKGIKFRIAQPLMILQQSQEQELKQTRPMVRLHVPAREEVTRLAGT
jgi:hypothetical protein